ncbi:uncharacterized protein LOC136080421 [Hydra vulgaris]|uniref:Uncharacterized protein LOC136080421 n=1 Tax=Hydra vulgaris TaxID=6087 RepID=A0ABM4BVA5_HYDVU
MTICDTTAVNIGGLMGKAVIGHLESCIDLVAVDSVYHNTFMTQFRLHVPSENIKGRLLSLSMSESFKKVCNWLEEDADISVIKENDLINQFLNLCDIKIPESQIELLNFGPHFVPSLRSIPYMDIITTTESSFLKLKHDKEDEKAQALRKNVLRELKMGKKTNHNLMRDQRKAFKEINQDMKSDIYPFDKGLGFVRIEHDKAIEKTRKHIGPTKIISIDPTLNYAIKIKSFLSKLNKKQSFSKDEYESIYPSDSLLPCLYGLIKAHKQDKSYPMRVVVSTIDTPRDGILNYLDRRIQPVSFDIVNLYPSIPLKETTLVLLDQLNKSVSYKNSTKLTLTETKQLIELCLFRYYFLWNGEIHELENLGPIGLSFMVVLVESFLQYHEKKAIKMAMTMIPTNDIKSFHRNVDDSHARFFNLNQVEQFQTILNRQHPYLKYIIEVKNKNKILNFLDITVINNTQGKYELKVYRKDAITNIQIKPYSNHILNDILKAIFNGYIYRVYSICSENHLKDEINILIQV